jgi:hypothetical protein
VATTWIYAEPTTIMHGCELILDQLVRSLVVDPTHPG